MTPQRLGKYEVVAKIGQGAMGEVFRAVDPLLGREVAVKTMSESIGADPDLRRRFQREAQSAARLNHPNVITVYDYGEENGQVYIAMELLEGRDLKEVIARRLPMSVEEKLQLMDQMAEGLAFAHAKGVVHRDLKPANIHVQPGGRVKIMDFGLARLASSDMTRAGAVLGTPNYMAPEQVRGETASAQCDIFSLGAVFYELLCGRKAFSGEALHAALYQVLQVEPERLEQLAPEVPTPLADVVHTALAKDPALRFRDGGELREALRSARREMGLGSIAREASTATLPASSAEPGSWARETSRPGSSASGPRSRSSAPGSRGRTSPPSAGAHALQPTVVRSERDQPTTLQSAPTGVSEPTRIASLPASALFGGEGGRSSRPLARLAIPGLVVGGLLALVGIVVAAVYFLLAPSEPARTPSARAPQVTRPAAPTPTPAVVETRPSPPAAEIRDPLRETRRALQARDWRLAEHAAGAALRSGDSPAAREALGRARAGLAAGAAAAQQARSALDAGDTDKAAAALAQLVAADPRHPDYPELSRRLAAAFSRLARATPPPLAQNERPTRQGTPPSTANPVTTAPAPSAPAPSTPTPAPRSTLPQAAAPQPPVPQAPTPTPAALPASPAGPAQIEAARQSIRLALENYRASFEMRNAEALRYVYPSVDYARYRDLFSKVDSYRARIEVLDIAVDGDRGRATCMVTYTMKPAPAGKNPPRRQVFHLRRSGEAWVIERIEAAS